MALTNSVMNRRNRILILITGLGCGGAEQQVVSLATELTARDWEVSVVCLVKPGGPSVPVEWRDGSLACVSQLQEQHVEVHSLDMKRGVPDLRGVFRLRSLIRSFRPDLVHCHMFHANILGRVTRLFCHMPAVICTAHNLKEAPMRGGPTWHKELLYRATDSLADQTTIICNAGFDRYVRVGAVPRKKLQMIPNGVDTNVFSRSEERRHCMRNALGIGSEFVWLAVGRLVEQKDYPNLLRALELLARQQFIVLIAGAGPLEKELREECTKRGLNGHVRFCGERKDILDLYNAADAFVMSSQCEGMPVALLEAASVGLPAVVTNVGGNPEVVTDGVTGYVVPPGSPTQLAAALQRLMEASPERLRLMSDAARQRCQDRYGIEVVIDKWLNLYADYLPVARITRVAHSVVPSREI
jgi:glycosyltransferase involved in cell wall biosynthesis